MENDETFIMVNLNETKSKELAQAISNETSRKILDYLSKKEEASESDLANELKVPISTIHYNLKHLMKAKLIECKEFKWSPKGKEVNLYKLSRKMIVIVPKGMSNVRKSLSTLLPVTFITAIGSGLFYYFNQGKMMALDQVAESGLADKAAASIYGQVATEKVVEGATSGAMAAGASEAASQVTQDQIRDTIVNEVINKTPVVHEPNIALWFFLGALAAIVLTFIFINIRKKKSL